MARIRTIKPDFFRHEALFDAERSSKLPLRVAFAGLWTACDREGRFVWKPRALKLDCLPYDEVDFAAVLEALFAHGFIVKYQVGPDTFGHIPSWADHQHVNQREAESTIPAPDQAGARTCETMPARGEGKGREQEGKGKGMEETREARSLSDPAPDLVFVPNRRQAWPQNAVLSDDWLRIAASKRAEAKLPALDLRAAATKFCNYHAQKSGGNLKTGTEWLGSWINFAIDEKAQNGTANGQHGRPIGRIEAARKLADSLDAENLNRDAEPTH